VAGVRPGASREIGVIGPLHLAPGRSSPAARFEARKTGTSERPRRHPIGGGSVARNRFRRLFPAAGRGPVLQSTHDRAPHQEARARLGLSLMSWSRAFHVPIPLADGRVPSGNAPLEEKFRGSAIDAKMQVPSPVFSGLLFLFRRTFGRCRFAR